ncbi:oligosaccharide flippase family protein [Bacteroides sp. KG123]|uniref:oligosaccharide flippase family protein n=1 Tax=unclassified Bacteroides TaxID=2646097 RepID=UPI003D7FEB6A
MAVNQLKAGVVLNYINIGLVSLIGLLFTPYLLRKLGQSEFGLYSLVSSIVAYLTVLDLGFANAIVRYTAKFRTERKKEEQYRMFGMFFLLYIAIGIIALIAGLILYCNVEALFGATMTINEIARAKIMILILVFNLTITFPMSIFGAIVTAYEQFVFQKIVSISQIILNYTMIFIILQIGFKAIGVVVVLTVFNVLALIVNFLYCRYKIHIKMIFGHFEWFFLKEVAIYSFWIFLNVIMDRIYWGTGQFVLGAVVGTAAVAVFAVAIKLETIYMSLSTAVVNVFLPKVTGMVANNCSEREISDLFIKIGRIQYIIVSFILSGFILFGKEFIDIWAGPGYEDAYMIALLFFISLSVPLIQNLGITILQARNQMKFRSLLYLIIAIIALLMQIFLSRYFGGIGCAIAIAGALFLGQGLIMNVYYHKVQKLDMLKFWREILKMSFVPVILVAIGFWLKNGHIMNNTSSLVLGIISFSIIYLFLFWFVGLNSSERNLISKPTLKILSKIK